jgi:hypothetical protein
VQHPALEQALHQLDLGADGMVTPDLPLHRRRRSAAVQADRRVLAALVRGRQVLDEDAGEVVIAGCEAHVCMMQTALGLLRAGKRVWVVASTSGSRRTGDHAAEMARLAGAGAGATIVTHEMVLFEWLGDCGHPRFREVPKIIKDPRGNLRPGEPERRSGLRASKRARCRAFQGAVAGPSRVMFATGKFVPSRRRATQAAQPCSAA